MWGPATRVAWRDRRRTQCRESNNAQKYYEQVSSGPPYSKMQYSIVHPTAFAKELGSCRDAMKCPSALSNTWTFWKMGIWFVGPINPPSRRTSAWYIITATKYLTRWRKAAPVKDCTADTAARFIFEHIVTRFGCPRILMSDQGSHFLNHTISHLTEEFMIHHQQSTPYHPRSNGTVEAFNKILKQALTKVCDDWDERVLPILWAYKTTSKKLTKHTPFRLVYGKEAIMPMEFLVPSLKSRCLQKWRKKGHGKTYLMSF